MWLNNGLKCDWCGKFVSFEDSEAMTWNEYGRAYDTEPPDPNEVCGKCWNSLTDKQKEDFENSVWRGPTRIFQEGIAPDGGL